MFPLANELGLSRIVREMWDSAACLDCNGDKCGRKFATRCRTKMISVSEDGDVYIIYNPCQYSKVPQGKLDDDIKRYLEHQYNIRRKRLDDGLDAHGNC